MAANRIRNTTPRMASVVYHSSFFGWMQISTFTRMNLSSDLTGSFYTFQDSWVIRLIFLSFSRFMLSLSINSEKWIPNAKKNKKLVLYLTIMDVLVFLEVALFLLLPITKAIFFISSPHNPLHPRQILPTAYDLNQNGFLNLIFLIFLVWTGCMSWYTIMLFAVMGTIYMGETTRDS